MKDNVILYAQSQDIPKIKHQENVNHVHSHAQYVDSLLIHVQNVHLNIINSIIDVILHVHKFKDIIILNKQNNVVNVSSHVKPVS